MRVYSIFKSISGEVSHFPQGTITTFVRLAGCSLGCNWCDTEYAKNKGTEMFVKEIFREIKKLKCKHVLITGGEPLEQADELAYLVSYLNNGGFFITIETNGAHFIPYLPAFWVADWKLPSSGVSERMSLNYYSNLKKGDTIKFVIASRKDFTTALSIRKYLKLIIKKEEVLYAFSPLDASPERGRELLDWMIESKLDDCVLSLQIHKVLGLVEDK